MTVSIRDQLRQYADQVTSESVPVELDQVGELLPPPVTQTIGPKPESLREPVVSAHRRGWLVAAGAAAAVLVLVGAVAMLSDVPERPAATPPIDSLSSLAWSRVPHDEVVFGEKFAQVMNSVTVGGPGLVAVGSVEPRNSVIDPDGGAAVWTSVDGIDWSRVPHDEAFSGGVMNSVTAGGPGLVAVGSATESEEREVAAVWTSVDGIAWSRVPHDESVFGGESDFFGVVMNSVTVGGPGLVAVGDVISGQGASSNAVVWTSPDGITWSRVPHDDAIFGRKELGRCCTAMSSVTAGGPGLVAVGIDWLTDTERGHATVWTSVDGMTWSRVPHDEAVFGDAGMHSVTAGGPGLVAVGSAGLGDDASVAAVWTSVDGVTWSRVAHDETVFGRGEGPSGSGGSGMGSVTAAGNGLVAVGDEFVRNTNLPYRGWVTAAAVWTSPDGVEWSRVPHDPSVFEAPSRPEALMNGVAAGGPGVVVVGVTTVHDFWADHNNSGESDAAVWVAGPTE